MKQLEPKHERFSDDCAGPIAMFQLDIADRDRLIAELQCDAFFHWLAGFIDGEGTFYIRRHSSKRHLAPTSYSPEFHIKLRDDDKGILKEIQHRTGIGIVKETRSYGPGKPKCIWRICRKADCLKLMQILDCHPLRAKNAATILCGEKP